MRDVGFEGQKGVAVVSRLKRLGRLELMKFGFSGSVWVLKWGLLVE